MEGPQGRYPACILQTTGFGRIPADLLCRLSV